MLGFVAGLNSYAMPVAFTVAGDSNGVQVSFGTWGKENPNRRKSVLESALRAQFSELEFSDACSRVYPPEFSAVIALGVPTGSLQQSTISPLDKILRGMSGQNFEIVILAEPLHHSVSGLIRSNALSESRRVHAEAQAEKAPSPMAEHYLEILKAVVRQSVTGSSVGVWRYAAYLVADTNTLPGLAGLWRAAFSGKESLPEPLVTWASTIIKSFASDWILPPVEAAAGPGIYRRMLEYQTVLTSGQLAHLLQLPRRDTPGFEVRSATSFDTSAQSVSQDKLPMKLGEVLVNARKGPPFLIPLDALVRHTFVAGVTGAGKTNTIRAIVRGIAEHTDRHFMVIEPAKTEYRSFIGSAEMQSQLRIYTMGNALISPFFLNPFEADVNTHVGAHLDLLKALFTASFGMWTPLPQILESCLRAVYADQGWDIVTGTNARFRSSAVPADAWPTMSQLLEKVAETIPTLGYDEKITSDMTASLVTRLSGLCGGAKGVMLDTQQSTDFREVLQRNTIFELEGIADDDEKAFVMGLLMIRLIEARRSERRISKLQHLLIIEEAHRLLSNPATGGNEEQANPRGKAVETFANLLAEARAFGQGFLIADQVPTKLAPDVIKNSNLKVAHRIVARDDREVLGGAMAMNDDQIRALSSLTVGQAVVFLEGEDNPLLINVTEVAESNLPWPPDEAVKQFMAPHIMPALAPWLHAPAAPSGSASFFAISAKAKAVIATQYFKIAFARFELSAVLGEGRLRSGLLAALDLANEQLPKGLQTAAFQVEVARHAVQWTASRRGRQREWSYDETKAFERAFLEFTLAAMGTESQPPEKTVAFATDVKKYFLRAQGVEPFPGCAFICREQRCQHRNVVADHVAWSINIRDEWDRAKNLVEPTLKGYQAPWSVLNRHAQGMTTNGEEEFLRERSLCIAQHLMREDPPHLRIPTLDNLIKAVNE